MEMAQKTSDSSTDSKWLIQEWKKARKEGNQEGCAWKRLRRKD